MATNADAVLSAALPLSPGSTELVEAALGLAGPGAVDTGTLLQALSAGNAGVRSVSLLKDYGLTPEAIAERLGTLDRAAIEGTATERPEGGRWTAKAMEALARAQATGRARHVPAVTMEVVLAALLADAGSIAPAVIRAIGASPTILRATLAHGFLLDFQPDVAAIVARHNLTVMGDDPPVLIGREQVISRITGILCRSERNLAVLVGPEGVGKRALLEHVAGSLLTDATTWPAPLAGTTMALADLAAVVAAGAAACQGLVEDVADNGRIAIAATSLAGLTLAPTITAAVLTPALASRRWRLLLTVSPGERAKLDMLEAGLRELFDVVEIDEPGKEHDEAVGAALGARFGERHGVGFTSAAARAACTLARRYLKEIAFPGSLAVLLDDVAGRARFQGAGADIDEGAVQEVVSVWSGVPVAKLTESEVARVQTMEEHLHERIVGQDEAVAAVARAIRRAKAGIKDPKRPVGSFLFLGPSGVGKTELAKALAEFLFGDESALVTFDMSEYGTEGDATKLIGTGPQWIGHDEGGQLTGAVKRRPYAVLLFDEVEKAHPVIFDLFLQLIDEGRLTDGSGVRVDFANAVVIMTSNLGTTALSGTESYDEMRAVADRALKAFFRPELLNRIDETIVFHRLTPEDVRKIAALMIRSLSKRTGVDLQFTEAAVDLVVAEGYDPELGARPLRRVLSRLVEDPLADLLLAGKAAKGGVVKVEADSGKLTLTPS